VSAVPVVLLDWAGFELRVTPVNLFRVIHVHVPDVNDNAPQFPVDSVTRHIYTSWLPATAAARFQLIPVAADDDAPPNDVRQHSLDSTTPPFRLEHAVYAGR